VNGQDAPIGRKLLCNRGVGVQVHSPI
jgi:hypothetical protein